MTCVEPIVQSGLFDLGNIFVNMEKKCLSMHGLIFHKISNGALSRERFFYLVFSIIRIMQDILYFRNATKSKIF